MLLQEMHAADYSPQSGERFTDEHFQLALDVVKQQEMDKAEVSDHAASMAESEKFGRTKASAEFLLNRMHVLVHGIAPHGETEKRAETMFTIPKSMIDFANRHGYDTFENIEQAREDLRNRPKKVKRPEAQQMMFQYYQEHKNTLPHNIRHYREHIIDQIMQGVSPEDAFAQVA